MQGVGRAAGRERREHHPNTTPNWERWEVLRAMTLTDLDPRVVNGYRAPYPSAEYLVGNRQFTQLLATTADNPQLPDDWEARVATRDRLT